MLSSGKFLSKMNQNEFKNFSFPLQCPVTPTADSTVDVLKVAHQVQRNQSVHTKMLTEAVGEPVINRVMQVTHSMGHAGQHVRTATSTLRQQPRRHEHRHPRSRTTTQMGRSELKMIMHRRMPM